MYSNRVGINKSSKMPLGLPWLFTVVPKPRTGGTAEPGVGQQREELARMVAELAATQQEQAAVWRRRREELQDQTERHLQRMENLAALIRSCPTPPPPPPALPNGAGVEEIQSVQAPVPAPRLRPASTQPATAPVPTPRVGAAGALQGPVPVPAPRKKAAEPAAAMAAPEEPLQPVEAAPEAQRGERELVPLGGAEKPRDKPVVPVLRESAPPKPEVSGVSRVASPPPEAGACRTSAQPPASRGARPRRVHLPRGRPPDQLRRRCWVRGRPPELTTPRRLARARGRRRSGLIPSPARGGGSTFGRMVPRPQSGDGGMWRGVACGAVQRRRTHLHGIRNHAPPN
ncbi:atherin-like [Haplochromis burtoni]|uniref:atherin-like n=1 Tax=Haplochromis burtoni TaxID=8153 RepID=UPI001C2DCB5E|nr:atherin-like [Haplochromis burtoni]